MAPIDRVAAADDIPKAEVKDSEKKAEEIDWERYLENHSLQQPIPSFRRGNEDELPGYEATLSEGEDLVDHMWWQIRMSDLVEDEQRFAALVLGNLDDAGYLKMEGVSPEDVVPKLASRRASTTTTRRRSSRSSSRWIRSASAPARWPSASTCRPRASAWTSSSCA
ncbi:MAG: hypothetical protein M5U28_49020 [Sandaracinaceae bacterium]|nr:hypothetical protein [Sandaracinaceae bacterium]